MFTNIVLGQQLHDTHMVTEVLELRFTFWLSKVTSSAMISVGTERYGVIRRYGELLVKDTCNLTT